MVLRETFTHLLTASSPKEGSTSLCLGELPKQKSLSSPSKEIFRGEHGEWAGELAITAAGTRNQQLCKLVGTAFFQTGREVARKNAELQHAEANPVPASTLAKHLEDFDKAWAGMERKWKRNLSKAERQKLDSLTTDAERDAFRILRSWSQTDKPDFKVHCRSLGVRLGMTWEGARNIRDRFCGLGIVRQTARYVPRQRAARYEWIADR